MLHLRCGFRCSNRQTWLCWFYEVDPGYGGSDFPPLGKQQMLFPFRGTPHASSTDEPLNLNLSSLFKHFTQSMTDFSALLRMTGIEQVTWRVFHPYIISRLAGMKTSCLSVQQCHIIFLSFIVFIVGWNIFSFVKMVSCFFGFFFTLLSFTSDLIIFFYFSNFRGNTPTPPTLTEGAHIAVLTIFIPPHQAN